MNYKDCGYKRCRCEQALLKELRDGLESESSAMAERRSVGRVSGNAASDKEAADQTCCSHGPEEIG